MLCQIAKSGSRCDRAHEMAVVYRQLGGVESTAESISRVVGSCHLLKRESSISTLPLKKRSY